MPDLHAISSASQRADIASQAPEVQHRVIAKSSPRTSLNSQVTNRDGDTKDESLKEAFAEISKLESTFNKRDQKLEMSVDSETGVLIVTITDKKTGDVVFQVPATVDVVRKGALFTGVGILIDEI